MTTIPIEDVGSLTQVAGRTLITLYKWDRHVNLVGTRSRVPREGAVGCSEREVVCLVSKAWEFVTDPSVRAFAWQLFKDLAAILGAVLAALKWYEKREGVIFGRIAGLLSEQNRLTQESCRRAIAAIVRPGPSEAKKTPAFVERALRNLFNRRHWKPVFGLGSLHGSVQRKLARAHSRLDQRQTAASRYQAFINEQRFSAFILQGAATSARTLRVENPAHLIQLNEEALGRFESALTVVGKSEDIDVVELRALQLQRLGRVDVNNPAHAYSAFVRLQTIADAHLASLDASADQEKIRLTLVAARARRYQAELLHASTPATGNGQALLASFETEIDRLGAPTGRVNLERARFYEVAACIRVSINHAGQLGIGPQTQLRIDKAINDYRAIQERYDPKNWPLLVRFGRLLLRMFRDDGSRELLQEARAGLSRVEQIVAGHGCAVCTSQMVDSVRTTTPNQ